jgi:hypothetical protein
MRGRFFAALEAFFRTALDLVHQLFGQLDALSAV